MRNGCGKEPTGMINVKSIAQKKESVSTSMVARANTDAASSVVENVTPDV